MWTGYWCSGTTYGRDITNPDNLEITGKQTLVLCAAIGGKVPIADIGVDKQMWRPHSPRLKITVLPPQPADDRPQTDNAFVGKLYTSTISVYPFENKWLRLYSDCLLALGGRNGLKSVRKLYTILWGQLRHKTYVFEI